MQGRAGELERIVEILRNAVVTPQITPDIVARQRDRRIKIVKDTSVSPMMVADRAYCCSILRRLPVWATRNRHARGPWSRGTRRLVVGA